MSINFAGSIRRVNGLNGPKWQEMYYINVLYNKIFVDLNKAISIMNFAKHFLNFSANAMILYLNLILDSKYLLYQVLSEPDFYGD